MLRSLATAAVIVLFGQVSFAQMVDATVLQRDVKWSIGYDEPEFGGPNKVFLATSILSPTSKAAEIGNLLVTTKQDGHNDGEMRTLHIDLRATLPDKSTKGWNANLVRAMVIAVNEARSIYNPSGLMTIDESMPVSCDIDIVALHRRQSNTGVPTVCQFSVQVSSRLWKPTSSQYANRLYTSTVQLISDFANNAKSSPWVRAR